MAKSTVYYDTRMPDEIVELMRSRLAGIENRLEDASTAIGAGKDVRNSQVVWIQDSSWVAAFCYYYIMKANSENFNYDIDGFEDKVLQYTYYGEGGHYTWHQDQVLEEFPSLSEEDNKKREASSINQLLSAIPQRCRKLSFSLQLSDPSEYSGGEFEIIGADGKSFNLPKKKGTMIIFDSRAFHRVIPVIEGQRRVLVGWVSGPRWR